MSVEYILTSVFPNSQFFLSHASPDEGRSPGDITESAKNMKKANDKCNNEFKAVTPARLY